jgi:hypothetical protein
MVSSSPDASIDRKVVNHCFGRNGNRPRQHAKSDSDLPGNTEPALEDDNGPDAHRN